MSPPQLSSSYPEENPERLPKYCANANYILTLLLDAYKFNETSWNNIFFQMKVGSKPSPWAGVEAAPGKRASFPRWGAESHGRKALPAPHPSVALGGPCRSRWPCIVSVAFLQG